MRFSLFNKDNKVQAINDDEVGSPMDVASMANEDFPDEEIPDEDGPGKRRSRFMLKSFFKKNSPEGKDATGKTERKPHLQINRMLGINTLITDSFYADKEDEVSYLTSANNPMQWPFLTDISPLPPPSAPRPTSGGARWTSSRTLMRRRAWLRAA